MAGEITIGQEYRENRDLWRMDAETLSKTKIPAAENPRFVRVVEVSGDRIKVETLIDVYGNVLAKPRFEKMSAKSLALHYVRKAVA